MVAAVFICLLAPSSAVAANGSISGEVTEAAVGHAAIEGVQVCATGIDAEEDFGCDTTDSVGTYSITGLEPGVYVVIFFGEDEGYLIQYYDGKSSFEDADEVTVQSGLPTPGIDAELLEGGRIEGSVIDAVLKTGVQQVEVCAYLEEGPEEFELGGCDEPGAAGAYEIDGLPEGDYLVEFWPYGEPGYIAEFYDDALFWQDGTLVEVLGGLPAAGIDAELAVGGRIGGTVTSAASGAPLDEIEVCAREAAIPHRYLRCGYTASTGLYLIRGLPTGSYKVEFTQWNEEFTQPLYIEFFNDKTTLAAAEPVVVTAPSTTGPVNAQLGPSPSAPADPGGSSPAGGGAAGSGASTADKPVGKPKPAQPKCKKGFRKKKVKGKMRCVKVKKRGKNRLP